MMVDRNSPLLEQLRAAAPNASNEGRDYWEWLFERAAEQLEAKDALIEFYEKGGKSMADVEKELDLKEPK